LRPDGEDILVKRVRLGSAAIEAVKYDEKKRTLDVEFREGDACRYMHVPEFVYRELLKAESAGAFWNAIKDQFDYVKLNQTSAKFVNGMFKDARRALPRKEKPRHLIQVAGFWRRPIDSFAPAHSPAARAGLTIYVARRPPATSLYGRRRSAAPCFE
jgi:KTSC domain